jgi:hypothetical protein
MQATQRGADSVSEVGLRQREHRLRPRWGVGEFAQLALDHELREHVWDLLKNEAFGAAIAEDQA